MPTRMLRRGRTAALCTGRRASDAAATTRCVGTPTSLRRCARLSVMRRPARSRWRKCASAFLTSTDPGQGSKTQDSGPPTCCRVRAQTRRPAAVATVTGGLGEWLCRVLPGGLWKVGAHAGWLRAGLIITTLPHHTRPYQVRPTSRGRFWAREPWS